MIPLQTSHPLGTLGTVFENFFEFLSKFAFSRSRRKTGERVQSIHAERTPYPPKFEQNRKR